MFVEYVLSMISACSVDISSTGTRKSIWRGRGDGGPGGGGGGAILCDRGIPTSSNGTLGRFVTHTNTHTHIYIAKIGYLTLYHNCNHNNKN